LVKVGAQVLYRFEKVALIFRTESFAREKEIGSSGHCPNPTDYVYALLML